MRNDASRVQSLRQKPPPKPLAGNGRMTVLRRSIRVDRRKANPDIEKVQNHGPDASERDGPAPAAEPGQAARRRRIIPEYQ